MDYRHPLEFGAFVTPSAANVETTVALAELAEAAGLDLVTFQDPPYQPSFLDTWTLMSFVAARTETIRIAPNVLNIPLRPPAVVARAAASLDLLSGGRFELGLGAGASGTRSRQWAARRLTPGQAVTALEEAIDVIRALWDTSERGGVFTEGGVHRVQGAKRGPRGAHAIPIWIGALKPRMLALTGREGDGWLPSLPYLKPGDLAAGNVAIDEAAQGVGRDPREIRRLLNAGSPESSDTQAWIEQLATMALEDGIGTFIAAGDDPRLLQVFGQEVAPAVRELVDRERSDQRAQQGLDRHVDETPFRSTAALARRREGIGYDDVPAGLHVVEPGDFEYHDVSSTYMRGGAPGLVLQPNSTAQVVEALAFARRHPDVDLSLRSGGHGISGRSTNDGGIVIDLRRLNAIEVLDEQSRLVRIGPGARWMEVAAALDEHGWALSSGDYGAVGVGGLATAGGIGWLAREHGLTIDHLRAAEAVLADGSVVRADAESRPDLFWALRGAGANMGIVTSFDFEVDEIGEIGWARLAFDASDLPSFLQNWGAAVEAAPRDLTSFLLLGGRRSGQPRVAQVLTVVDASDPDTIIERLQPLAGVAPLLDQSVQLTTYARVMANADLGPQHGAGEPVSRTMLVDHLTPEFARAAERMLDTGASYFFQIRSVGGAVSDVAEEATAYAHRAANFSVVAVGTDAERMERPWRELAEHSRGIYLSFDSSRRPERIAEAFPPATLARLRAIKAEVDPESVFRDNFAISPQVAVTG